MFHSIKKTLLTAFILSIAFFLSGCGTASKENANAAFENLSNTLISTALSENALDLHFCISDPSQYGIGESPLSLGHISADAFRREQALYNQMLVSFSEINRSALSEENAYLYDIICSYLKNHSAILDFTYKYEPLSSYSGEHVQLPLMLSEYTFSTEQDIKDYFSLCELLPEYLNELAEYEKEKAAAGGFMSESAYKSLIDFCTHFATKNVSEHFLAVSFQKRLNKLDLEDDLKNAYNNKNETMLKETLFPAYANLSAAISQIAEENEFHNSGLCSLPSGRKYFELLVRDQTGDARSILEIGAEMAENINALSDDLAASLTENMQLWEIILTGDLNHTLNSEEAFAASKQYLSVLSALTEDSFGTAKCDYTVNFIEPALSEYFSSAFFLIPPVDDQESPGIYINPDTQFSPFDLFTTLAHEGFPGHLLQNNTQKNNIIPRLFSCLGYCEGWATYSELFSYPIAVEELQLSGDNDPADVAEILKTYRKLTLCLYALLDYNINYNYWTADDAAILLSSYGISNPETIQEIYNYIVSEPANYMTYYIGYVNIEKLKEKYMAKGHTEDEFHKAFLSCIEAPFDIVEAKLLQ